MFKKLNNQKGWVPMVIVLAMAFIALPFMTPRHKRQSAIDICYCIEEGSSEAYCKSDDAVIDPQPGLALHTCKLMVRSMTKNEIRAYIEDNIPGVPHGPLVATVD